MKRARSALAVLLGRTSIAALVASAGCAAAPAASGTDSATLAAAVRSLIGDAPCTGDEQCRTLAFGAKACGGPQAYLAWSTLATDEAALQAAAQRHAARRRDEIRERGLLSDCALVVDPGAYCAPPADGAASGQRSCRLLSPGRGTGREAR